MYTATLGGRGMKWGVGMHFSRGPSLSSDVRCYKAFFVRCWLIRFLVKVVFSMIADINIKLFCLYVN